MTGAFCICTFILNGTNVTVVTFSALHLMIEDFDYFTSIWNLFSHLQSLCLFTGRLFATLLSACLNLLECRSPHFALETRAEMEIHFEHQSFGSLAVEKVSFFSLKVTFSWWVLKYLSIQDYQLVFVLYHVLCRILFHVLFFLLFHFHDLFIFLCGTSCNRSYFMRLIALNCWFCI